MEMNFNSNSESRIDCLTNIPQDFSSDKGKLRQTNKRANQGQENEKLFKDIKELPEQGNLRNQDFKD